MAPRATVLVIEDDLQFQKFYRRSLERANYVCEIVDARDQAIDALRNKSFDAAIVDLQLRNDVGHKGGIDVLEYIGKCREDTKAFAISGTPEPRDVVASIKFAPVEFILKDDLETTDDILPKLEKALPRRSQTVFGDYKSLSEYLCAPDGLTFWENQIYGTLGCSYQQLTTFLDKAFRKYLPILRQKNSNVSFRTDRSQQTTSGIFWSKSLGAPIWVAACGRGKMAIEPDSMLQPELDQENLYSAPNFKVWRLSSPSRSDFAEFVWETPWR